MDKKNFNKMSNFFKKEGFYVVLFVCLCVVATVAAVTSKSNKTPVKPPVVQESAKDAKGSEIVAQEANEEYDNALQVKKNTVPSKSTVDNTQTNNTKTKTSTNKTSAAVSKTVDTKFANPVEGTLARAYSEDPVWSDSTSTYRPVLGIDIKTDLGKEVVAALDGKVLEVGEGEYGKYVAIYHQNGLTTVYANLDPDIKVSKDKSVKKGEVIGKVGNTSLRSGYEKYGSHLHFEVVKGKDITKNENKVDPAKYVKYTLSK